MGKGPTEDEEEEEEAHMISLSLPVCRLCRGKWFIFPVTQFPPGGASQ